MVPESRASWTVSLAFVALVISTTNARPSLECSDSRGVGRWTSWKITAPAIGLLSFSVSTSATNDDAKKKKTRTPSPPSHSLVGFVRNTTNSTRWRLWTRHTQGQLPSPMVKKNAPIRNSSAEANKDLTKGGRRWACRLRRLCYLAIATATAAKTATDGRDWVRAMLRSRKEQNANEGLNPLAASTILAAQAASSSSSANTPHGFSKGPF
eukprot:jgi/Bigna1/75719/fgenesh1_pg.36_\